MSFHQPCGQTEGWMAPPSAAPCVAAVLPVSRPRIKGILYDDGGRHIGFQRAGGFTGRGIICYHSSPLYFCRSPSLSISLPHSHTLHTHGHPHAPAQAAHFNAPFSRMHYIHHRALFRFESGTVSLRTILLPNLIARTRIA